MHQRRTGDDGADEWIELTQAEHTDGISFILPQGNYLARARLDQATVEVPVQVKAAESQVFELPLNAGEVHLQAVLQGYREPLLDAGFRLRRKTGPDETAMPAGMLQNEQGEAHSIVPAGRYLAVAQADAAATALLVAGLEGWPEVARALDLQQIAVVDENGTVYMTPEMEKRLQFIGDVERVIVEIPAMDCAVVRHPPVLFSIQPGKQHPRPTGPKQR